MAPGRPARTRTARARPAREARWLRSVPGLATAAVLAVGCTTRPVMLDGTPAAGQIVVLTGRPGVVVAAPPGTPDMGTGEMAAEIARRTGFGLVAATGFNVEPDAYERLVRKASQGPLDFYVEIHGHDRRESADRIEVATVGVSAEAAVKLRTLLELVRDAHLRARVPGTPLHVGVEPAHGAAGADGAGILRLPRRALRIELPRLARGEVRELYTLILSDFLREAVALPSVARR